MRILEKGGVLGEGGRDWRNVSQHCLAEAVAGDILAEHLGANRKKIVMAILLHDWYKRKEVEAMREKGGAAGYATTSGDDERLLAEYGVPDEIIKLAHSNIPESLDPVYLENRALEEKIMHYVDVITSDTDLTPARERLAKVRKKPNIAEFLDSFKQQYFGKALDEANLLLTDLDGTEFEQKLEISPGTLIDFVKEKLQERVECYARASATKIKAVIG